MSETTVTHPPVEVAPEAEQVFPAAPTLGATQEAMQDSHPAARLVDRFNTKIAEGGVPTLAELADLGRLNIQAQTDPSSMDGGAPTEDVIRILHGAADIKSWILTKEQADDAKLIVRFKDVSEMLAPEREAMEAYNEIAPREEGDTRTDLQRFQDYSTDLLALSSVLSRMKQSEASPEPVKDAESDPVASEVAVTAEADPSGPIGPDDPEEDPAATTASPAAAAIPPSAATTSKPKKVKAAKPVKAPKTTRAYSAADHDDSKIKRLEDITERVANRKSLSELAKEGFTIQTSRQEFVDDRKSWKGYQYEKLGNPSSRRLTREQIEQRLKDDWAEVTARRKAEAEGLTYQPAKPERLARIKKLSSDIGWFAVDRTMDMSDAIVRTAKKAKESGLRAKEKVAGQATKTPESPATQRLRVLQERLAAVSLRGSGVSEPAKSKSKDKKAKKTDPDVLRAERDDALESLVRRFEEARTIKSPK